MTETIYTLSLHACAEGDILPLAFLPATAAPAPFAVHGMAARPLPDGNRDWRVGTCLYDASGVARLKVTGRMFLPPSILALDAPHTQICTLSVFSDRPGPQNRTSHYGSHVQRIPE